MAAIAAQAQEIIAPADSTIIPPMQPHHYTFIFALGVIVAGLDAYGIGANDVANGFASSVGSGSISLLTACLIALFTEFLGAFLLGSNTAETVKSGIIDIN
ncbi:hypothetical protein BZG36_02132 [Bifiguratus adelaidae]|uniref:Phosphate permease n=1 Tax=Bifiguratus adelaidae TaxID=1938954 RepID=A0A261Y339_9FUNG|nr:hypothetical protein BZG36_02132 [Bifiguratus adelaidae]